MPESMSIPREYFFSSDYFCFKQLVNRYNLSNSLNNSIVILQNYDHLYYSHHFYCHMQNPHRPSITINDCYGLLRVTSNGEILISIYWWDRTLMKSRCQEKNKIPYIEGCSKQLCQQPVTVTSKRFFLK